MSTEITDAEQLRAARILHERAKTRRVAKVAPDTNARFAITDENDNADSYVVRGGEMIWLDVATDSTFYVTLEDQGVQLTFIVIGENILVAKKRLRYGDRGTVGARARRSVTLSSSSS